MTNPSLPPDSALAPVDASYCGREESASELCEDQLNELLLVRTREGSGPSSERRRKAKEDAESFIDLEQVNRCYMCNASINLPMAKAGEPISFWRCNHCKKIIAAAPQSIPFPSDRRIGCTLAESVSARDLAPRGTASTRELISLALDGAAESAQDRAGERHALSIPMLGAPLSEQLATEGKTISLICRDVSDGGLSFFSKRKIESPMVLLDFGVAGMPGRQLLVHLVRDRYVGLYYEYGCKIVS